jgi:hypothetical protein
MKKMRKRVVCEYEHFLDAQSAEIFPLLCPVREYEWIPQWRCDIIYTQSGVAELGCVFTTDYDDDFGKETWVVFSYAPSEKIAFVRTGKHRTTRYEVYLQPREKGTLIRWSQEITALDSRGDDLLAEFSQASFEAFMIPLNRMLAHYLATGKAMELSLES